jgi:TetR/AcrR family transcriptional regulator, transcriptional repressor for nem operon
VDQIVVLPSKGEATRNAILEIAEGLVLTRGFAGTSLDDILAKAKLTKGAFFYHFRSKADLARALVERYAREDQRLFNGFLESAEAASDNPYAIMLASLRNFEDFIVAKPRIAEGCVFASYSYEELQFDAGVHKLVREGLDHWQAHYRGIFERVIAVRAPRAPTSADELARMIVAVIQGGLVLARVRKDAGELVRAVAAFRHYVARLFSDDPASPAGATA